MTSDVIEGCLALQSMVVVDAAVGDRWGAGLPCYRSYSSRVEQSMRMVAKEKKGGSLSPCLTCWENFFARAGNVRRVTGESPPTARRPGRHP